MPSAENGPRREIHVARKNYPCSSPTRACTRRILRGDPYTQVSYAPYQAPFTRSGVWTILRVCSTCQPISAAESPVPLPCPYGSSGTQCVLSEGHDAGPNPTPHQLAPEALF